jgi:hypothetical protein
VTLRLCYSRGALPGESRCKPFHVMWFREDAVELVGSVVCHDGIRQLATSDTGAEDGQLVGEGSEDRRQFNEAVGLGEHAIKMILAVVSHDVT